MSDRLPYPCTTDISVPADYCYATTAYEDRQKMEWHGTVGQALDELRPIIAKNAPKSDSSSWLKRTADALLRRDTYVPPPPDPSLEHAFWAPSRLMRAIIDSALDGPTRIEAVNAVTQLSLNLFANGTDQQGFTRVSKMFERRGLTGIEITQPYDGATFDASTPYLARRAAERLSEKTTAPLFVLPLCHGGFTAGIEMALEHKRLNPNSDMRIYPVRYSRQKLKDPDPRISQAEMDYIKMGAENRTILVFDEDAGSGKSVGNTVKYLKRNIWNTVIGMVADDSQRRSSTERHIATQGTWWENV